MNFRNGMIISNKLNSSIFAIIYTQDYWKIFQHSRKKKKINVRERKFLLNFYMDYDCNVFRDGFLCSRVNKNFKHQIKMSLLRLLFCHEAGETRGFG